MDYKSMLYFILEHSSATFFDAGGAIDLAQLQNLLMKECPGKYHLEWVSNDSKLGIFDTIDVNKIKIVFHSPDEHVEWMLRYG
jgi:hypothetical protein